jgi:hypothetical protein
MGFCPVSALNSALPVKILKPLLILYEGRFRRWYNFLCNFGKQSVKKPSMIPGQGLQEYRPEQLSRRGEMVAWGSAFLVAVGWIILIVSRQPVLPAVVFLEIFLLLAASSISLGNWMDRKTVIQMDESGLKFQNGLRNIRLDWSQVKEVRVSPSQWGKKVQVIGDHVYFAFRTLGEVKVQGEVKGRMGFEKGEEILRQIVSNSGLEIVGQDGEGYYYYAHK